jgi:hypothetical protein
LEGSGRERYLVVEVFDVRPPGRTVKHARLRLAGTVAAPSTIPALAALLVKGETSPFVELGLLSMILH